VVGRRRDGNMMLEALAGITQQQGAGGFNPETDITWQSLFWAEGTAFKALGLADGDNVPTWPNETGESDADHSGNQPTYDSANASFNGRPVISFAGSQSFITSDFTTPLDYSSTVSFVMVGKRSGTGNQAFFDGNNSGRNLLWGYVGKWGFYAGSIRNAIDYDSDSHLFVANFDGGTGNDFLELDGVSLLDINAGSQTVDGVAIGSTFSPNTFLQGQIPFFGVFEGDITAAGSVYADLKTWVTDHYGITVA
jgi:hypothetical protein